MLLHCVAGVGRKTEQPYTRSSHEQRVYLRIVEARGEQHLQRVIKIIIISQHPKEPNTVRTQTHICRTHILTINHGCDGTIYKPLWPYSLFQRCIHMRKIHCMHVKRRGYLSHGNDVLTHTKIESIIVVFQLGAVKILQLFCCCCPSPLAHSFADMDKW